MLLGKYEIRIRIYWWWKYIESDSDWALTYKAEVVHAL